MSEIIHTETVEQNRHLVDDMHTGQILADVKYTLFQSNDKVALVTSQLTIGRPRLKDGAMSDKRYYKWRSCYSTGFRRGKTGMVIPYQCQRTHNAPVGTPWAHQQTRMPFAILDGKDEITNLWRETTIPYSDDMKNKFRHAVWESFGITQTTDLFPMMNEYGLSNYHTIPNNLHDGFRADNWSEYIARVFGKTRVTPRLEAAVKATDPYYTAYARNFRGLVEGSKIESFLERNHFDEHMEITFQPHTPDFRSGLLVAVEGTRNALIDLTISSADMNIIRQVSGMGGKKIQKDTFAGKFTKWSDFRWYW